MIEGQDPGDGRGRSESLLAALVVCLGATVGVTLIAAWSVPAFVVAAALVPLVSVLRQATSASRIVGHLEPRRTAIVTLSVFVITWVPAVLTWHLWRGDAARWRFDLLPAFAGLAGLLAEELFFRGWMMARAGQGSSKKVRILAADLGWEVPISACFFAVAHVPRFGVADSWFYVFPGLSLAYARIRSGNLLAPIILHLLYNALRPA
ncbi:MAG: CPBP family intramembrane metalloprotease [Planctomycetes bacterium]|nr:CPBP family intramembrane metalloprotease [Planctomycetota bacterium]